MGRRQAGGMMASHHPPLTFVRPLPSLFPTCRDPLITFDGDSTPHKTSIVFSLGDGPGQLFKGALLNKCERKLLGVE